MNEVHIGIAGAGALGSSVAAFLARPGVRIFLFDDDDVEEGNIINSWYTQEHVGRSKAVCAAEIVGLRGGAGVPIVGTIEKPEDFDIEKHDLDLLIDCFDNPEARKQTVGLDIPVLHLGVGTGGNGIVYWDDVYKLPPVNFERGNNPICTRGLGQVILFRTAIRGYEVANEWISTNNKTSELVTEKGEIG